MTHVALPTDPDRLVGHLSALLTRGAIDRRRYDEYFEGEQPIRFLASELQRELGDRIGAIVINWPRMATEAYENRLDVTDFRYARADPSGDDALDDLISDGWLANDMDHQSGEAHLESLIHGRSFAIVGAGEDGSPPLITVEHPDQVHTVDNPRTRQVAAAVKRWQDQDDAHRATLYLPDETRYYTLVRGLWREERSERDEHQLGVPPVIPLLNHGRMLNRVGRSEFADIIPVADAVNKLVTDMMVSAEFHAMPRRYAIGMRKEDFAREDGTPLTPWEQIAGRVWSTELPPDEVQFGQFAESDLSGFHGSIKLLAMLAAQLLGLPPHYMTFGGDNPASADAIRSAEAQMVKRAERKQRALGRSWKLTMRLWHRMHTGRWDERLRTLETVWRDAATPTVAQVADAATKKFQAKIVPLRQTRIDLGYSEGQIKLMEAEDEAAARRDPLAAVGKLIGQSDDDAGERTAA